MRGAAVGVIISSKSRTFPVGSYVGSDVGWAEYAIVKEKHLERLDLPQNAKITDALGILGEYLSYMLPCLKRSRWKATTDMTQE
jgi:hypothetical protein